MVTFGEITRKDVRANYTKDDIADYKVVGAANYNKERRLSDANGDIRDAEGKHIANFNVYNAGGEARVNLTDCLAGMMGKAVEIAEATLADLAADYPEA